MAKKKALGKGLGAIFGDDVINESRETARVKNVSRETSDNQLSGTNDSSPYSIVGESRNQTVMEGSENYRAEKYPAREESGKEYMVKISLIEPNSGQPRKNFDPEQIKELSESIKKYGILQPLLVQNRCRRKTVARCTRSRAERNSCGSKRIFKTTGNGDFFN